MLECLSFTRDHGSLTLISSGFCLQEAALRCLIDHGAVINFCDADIDDRRSNASRILSDLTINPLSLALEKDHHK